MSLETIETRFNSRQGQRCPFPRSCSGPTEYVHETLPEIQGWADADHSPQTSGKAKNVWSYKFIPPYAFMGGT
jgi:hypothetical protein